MSNGIFDRWGYRIVDLEFSQTFVDGWCFAFANLSEDLSLIERRSASEQAKERRTEAIDIVGAGGSFAQCLLGADEAERLDRFRGIASHSNAAKRGGTDERAELDPFMGIEQQVRGAEIAVDYAGRMSGIESGRKIAEPSR